jgi:hypothetical protein
MLFATAAPITVRPRVIVVCVTSAFEMWHSGTPIALPGCTGVFLPSEYAGNSHAGDNILNPHEALVATITGAVQRPGRYELVGTKDITELVSIWNAACFSYRRDIINEQICLQLFRSFAGCPVLRIEPVPLPFLASNLLFPRAPMGTLVSRSVAMYVLRFRADPTIWRNAGSPTRLKSKFNHEL